MANAQKPSSSSKTDRNALVTIEVDSVLQERELAILVRVGGDSDHWIPRSQIHPTSEVKDIGDEGALIVPAWLAEKDCIPLARTSR